MLLGRYIFREIVPSSLLGTVLSTIVIFLQSSGRFFEILVRSSARPKDAAYLFLLSLPQLLPMTIPFGALVGILVGLGRLSTDGEITAMRAAGVPSQKVIAPVMLFGLLATAAAGASSIWLTPAAIAHFRVTATRLSAGQLTAEIQERVFAEQFPNKILYVENVKTGPVTQWQNVFIADLTPPEERTSGMRDKASGPLITVAREAIPVPDPKNNRIQLSLRDAVMHEVDKDGTSYDQAFKLGEQALPVNPPSEQRATDFKEMRTRELPWHARYSPKWLEARIELHRRLALPIGCLALALVGIPLGISSRKGGKSGGYVTALFLAFFCYYLSFLSLLGLAEQQRIPVWLAAWGPNIVFAAIGVISLARLEKPGDRDLLGAVRSWFQLLGKKLESAPATQKRRWAVLPQILDTYVLTQFLFYFLLWLASWVALTEVYNFFELLGDIVKNKIAMAEVAEYLFFLAPKLIYDFLPISVLMAVLVTFGILTKNNEVTAFKASGVSLFRLTAPVLAASAMLSTALFAFDHYYVPTTYRRQDALRDKIKGRPVQTYLRSDRKWIKGNGERIYYYKYFDAAERQMLDVSVYELEPKTFSLKREITAARAQWQPSMGRWIFQNGWRRDILGSQQKGSERFEATTFPELNEPPDYFLKEARQDKTMNFQQLQTYIDDLERSGFDTVHLRVQLQKKFSVPLFALIMAMISAPFAFLVGNRGAMASIGFSIGIAITYLAVEKLFEEIGAVNHLPPGVAAWSPDAVFALLGIYLLLNMRS